MNVAFFGQTGPYSPTALRQLLGQQLPTYRIRAVVEGVPRSQTRRTHRWFPGRRRASDPQPDLMQTAVAAGIETLQTSDVNAPYVANVLAQREIDVLVCAGFSCLFGPGLLACAPRGGLNAHASLLPRWRGPSPIFWALRQGDARMGVTIHHLDAREDHGPIIAQEAFCPRPKAAGDVIFGQAGALAGALLHTALQKMVAKNLSAVAQAELGSCRAPRPKPEDAQVKPRTWRCAHLVDFACGAPFFRAPWMQLGGETFHLRTGVEALSGHALPGEFVLHGDRLWVACSDGTAVLQIQD